MYLQSGLYFFDTIGFIIFDTFLSGEPRKCSAKQFSSISGMVSKLCQLQIDINLHFYNIPLCICGVDLIF